VTVRMRDRRRHYLPAPPDLLVEDFDEGEDEALALLEHEAATLGCIPLHPDEDRKNYDPVPLQGGDDRLRWKHKPKPWRAARARPGPTKAEREAALRWREAQEEADIHIAWLQRPGVQIELPAVVKTAIGDVAKQLEVVAPIPRLPLDFPWLVAENKVLTQGQVEAFWFARQDRQTWQQWAYSPIDRNPKVAR
jgi:hypothetical protein